MAIDTRPRSHGTRGTAPQAPPRSETTPGRPEGLARPVSSPRHTRPASPGKPVAPGRTTPGRAAAPSTQRPLKTTTRPGRQQRMPFILLLVGLLGGALVCLLVISTTLDAGAYRITNLTNSNDALTKDIQALNQEVANGQSLGMIAQEAYQLGMRHDNNLLFVNTKTGKLSSSAPVVP